MLRRRLLIGAAPALALLLPSQGHSQASGVQPPSIDSARWSCFVSRLQQEFRNGNISVDSTSTRVFEQNCGRGLGSVQITTSLPTDANCVRVRPVFRWGVDADQYVQYVGTVCINDGQARFQAQFTQAGGRPPDPAPTPAPAPVSPPPPPPPDRNVKPDRQPYTKPDPTPPPTIFVSLPTADLLRIQTGLETLGFATRKPTGAWDQIWDQSARSFLDIHGVGAWQGRPDAKLMAAVEVEVSRLEAARKRARAKPCAIALAKPNHARACGEAS